MKNRLLLSCGILSSLLYIAMNVFIPSQFAGYDIGSQTISELSALAAPTRGVWLVWATIYVVLLGFFGWGILKTAGGNWLLHIVAYLVLIYTAINLYWPPMHLRGAEASLSDKLHIVWALVTIVLMMLIMGFAMVAMDRVFRWYTIATFLVFLVFGMLTFTEAPGIARNLPTPYIGWWERVNVGAFMIWMIVFSFVLLKQAVAKSRAEKPFVPVFTTAERYAGID